MLDSSQEVEREGWSLGKDLFEKTGDTIVFRQCAKSPGPLQPWEAM
jgi:hypothetical protein